MSITPIGKTTVLTPAGSTAANVGNIAARTNTFHVANSSTNKDVFVGVFNNYADAVAMDHPSVGNDTNGVILMPLESMTIQGNFGTAGINSVVYIAAVTASGSTVTTYFTPVAP